MRAQSDLSSKTIFNFLYEILDRNNTENQSKSEQDKQQGVLDIWKLARQNEKLFLLIIIGASFNNQPWKNEVKFFQFALIKIPLKLCPQNE